MLVNILDAKNQLSRLIKRVQAGEEVVIANRGEPVARLVPAGPTARAATQAGNGRVILEYLQSNRLPDYARRSAPEIDAAIAAERDAWD
jgi:prevent-host-death family protein